jgi:REP element-mobilizing transposase RayT
MARTLRINKDSANYHIMSRTNAKAFLFDDGALKSSIVEILKRVAAFSGVKIHAYCIMDDHFHIVCNITKSENVIPEATVIERIRLLKGSVIADSFARNLLSLRKNKSGKKLVEKELDRWRSRMEDVSEFTKTFKELVNVVYKKKHSYSGSIWNGRFKSTIIENGEYLRNCIRYVEYNPVRARIVNQADKYFWSSRNASISSSQLGYAAKGNEWMMRRWVQIGSGKIFGSRGFVEIEIGVHSACFNGSRVKARQVAGMAYAAYGQRLAQDCA